MSSNKTSNLNLHSWEAADAFTREEFNENFAAIDADSGATWEAIETETAARLASAPRIVYGTYTGTAGTSSNGLRTQTVNLGFQPKAVLIVKGGCSWDASGPSRSALLLRGYDISASGYGVLGAVTASGFTVASYMSAGSESVSPSLNFGRYYYLAIG